MGKTHKKIISEEKDFVIYSERNHPFPIHNHGAIEITYVKSGKLKAIVDNNILEVNENEMLIIKSYSLHSFLNDFHNEKYSIIPLPLLPDRMKYFGIGKYAILDDKAFNKALLPFISQYYLLFASKKVNFQSSKGFTLMLFSLLEKKYNVFDNNDRYQLNLFENILKYIYDNFRTQITLDTLAEITGYNKFYISKNFNKFFNMKITDYINNIRLCAFVSAITLDSNVNISKLALDCGFNSVSNFYNCFSKLYGVSPNEFVKHVNLLNT